MLRKILDWLEGKKVFALATILATVDVLQATDIAPLIPASYQTTWTCLHPFAFAYLRLITKGPAFDGVPRL